MGSLLAFGPLSACGAPVTVARHTRRPAYTTFVYLEDDLHLQWHSLEAWARATPALEPLSFLYGFYKTENSPEIGQLMSLDAASRADMRTYNRTVHVPRVGSFIQLPQPYFGLWLATHSQLLHFVRSAFLEEGGRTEQQGNFSGTPGAGERDDPVRGCCPRVPEQERGAL